MPPGVSGGSTPFSPGRLGAVGSVLAASRSAAWRRMISAQRSGASIRSHLLGGDRDHQATRGAPSLKWFCRHPHVGTEARGLASRLVWGILGTAAFSHVYHAPLVGIARPMFPPPHA